MDQVCRSSLSDLPIPPRKIRMNHDCRSLMGRVANPIPPEKSGWIKTAILYLAMYPVGD